MGAVAEIGALLRNGLTAWRDISLADVLFGHRDTTILALIVLVGLAAGVAVLRVALGRRRGRAQVGLPALMSWARSSPWASVRHGAVLLSLAGVPFFMLALADPFTRLRQQEVSFPGRRIALLIDASASMVIPFQAARLNAKGPNQASFFTTIGAAETFIRQRMKGRYRDLIALDRVRRRSLCRDAVHQRLRQHSPEPVAHRRLDRVHEVFRSGDDDWKSDR